MAERSDISRVLRRLAQGARTAAWVAVITVLIWVYADIQFTETRDARATLRVQADRNPALAVLEPEEPLPISFRVKGNRHMIDAFLERLAASGSLLSFNAANLEPLTRHRERLADLLSALPELREGGLEVVLAQPQNLDIFVDTYKTVPATVEFAPSGAEFAQPPPRIEPPRVNLSVPSTLAARLSNEPHLATEALDVGKLPTGQPITRSLAVIPPDLPGARVEPPKVQVTFQLAQQQAATKALTVPIQVQMPQDWARDDTWAKYKLLVPPIEEWTRAITFTGPRIYIDQLREKHVQAFITLKESDKKDPVATWLERPVQVQVVPTPEAPDLHVQVDPREPVKPVSFRMEKRTEASP